MYGVGSPESSASARLQLALGLHLADALDVRGGGGAVHFFDPVVSDADAVVLREAGVERIAEDERGMRTATAPVTLFYMPHCEAWLYDNLVSHNAREGRSLHSCIVLGNSFDRYETMWDGGGSSRPPGERPAALLATLRDERSVAPFEYKGNIAFAEMAVVSFPEREADAHTADEESERSRLHAS